MTGTIVLLNGAPRSGKSSIVRAVQERVPGIWLNLGVDVAMAAQPPAIHPGIGLRPGGERPDLEPLIQQLYGALFDSIAACARAGVNVVGDFGLHDAYSRPLGILADAVKRLAGLPVLFIGIRAPLEVIMARRNADSRGGYYEGGEQVPVPVRLWQDVPHAHGVYDLEIDTSHTTSEQASDQIASLLQTWPSPTAFETLRTR